MVSYSKPEWPPLLPPGLHPKSITEVEELCVAYFPLSATRQKLMAGLRKIVEMLVGCKIVGELWADGSFLTEEVNPGDVDLVLCTSAEFYDNGTDEQKKTLRWLDEEDLRPSHGCDSRVALQYPASHIFFGCGSFRTGQLSRRCKGLARFCSASNGVYSRLIPSPTP